MAAACPTPLPLSSLPTSLLLHPISPLDLPSLPHYHPAPPSSTNPARYFCRTPRVRCRPRLNTGQTSDSLPSASVQNLPLREKNASLPPPSPNLCPVHLLTRIRARSPPCTTSLLDIRPRAISCFHFLSKQIPHLRSPNPSPSSSSLILCR